MNSYCLRCKRTTTKLRVRRTVSRNGRHMLRGKCCECGTTNVRFVQKGGDTVDSLNALTRRVKLPWTKFRGEMHLPGHNFTGPGTKLDKRLNEDGMPKWWSRPVNRVDRAAYHHDLAYAKYKNRAKRIEADKKMIRALDTIDKPTLRERLERAVVRPIISAKAKIGM